MAASKRVTLGDRVELILCEAHTKHLLAFSRAAAVQESTMGPCEGCSAGFSPAVFSTRIVYDATRPPVVDGGAHPPMLSVRSKDDHRTVVTHYSEAATSFGASIFARTRGIPLEERIELWIDAPQDNGGWNGSVTRDEAGRFADWLIRSGVRTYSQSHRESVAVPDFLMEAVRSSSHLVATTAWTLRQEVESPIP